MPGKKKSEMSPEEIEQMNEKMKKMRELAIAKKLEMSEGAKAEKEVKEQLYEQKRQEVLKKKEEANKVKELIEQPQQQAHAQALDVEALRKQIKQEVKQKYKAKYQTAAPPPYYNPWFGMPMHAPPPPPTPTPPVAQQQPDLEETVKSIGKEELKRKLQHDLLKMVSASMF
jgi:hypothetical protein